MTKTLMLSLCLSVCQLIAAMPTDSLRNRLLNAAERQVQEKVYIHTDNQCYFVGDTLWYKAYVVRADDLMPTDMSRILYVELLSPDGLLVERQNIIVSNNGHSCGQFVLTDSLYSGYYELRAYTRWMLNFGVSHLPYRREDTWAFYNRQMAADYYRVWDGLYSRVLPIYSRPEVPGDYDARRMYQRPKERVPSPKKEELLVTFFPEGGSLIAGVPNRIAFEATDQLGQAVSVSGTIDSKSGTTVTAKTEHHGRGTFMLTPGQQKATASFTYHGKKYDFTLPKAETTGIAIQMDDSTVQIQRRQLPPDSYGIAVMCRGILQHFDALPDGNTFQLPFNLLPTGVNELVIFDSEGRAIASRLFFVNHHENDNCTIVPDDESMTAVTTLKPYQMVSYPVRCQGVIGPVTMSIAIRDTNTDEPTYDNGNIMTDLLLSSDLKGFIAKPAYYFEADDAQHRRHLDLLMMVQGWRKYSWQQLIANEKPRYTPEKTLTVEGVVCKTIDIDDVDPQDVGNWQYGTSISSQTTDIDEEGNEIITTEYSEMNDTETHIGENHRTGRREVLIEAEVNIGGQYVGGVQKTQKRHFTFQIPPFYGNTYLDMKAYSQSDSVKRNMQSRSDTHEFDELAYPDYYVKRELWHPAHANKYDYYQNHQPDYDAEILIDTLSELYMENDVHQLANINVKGKRRGRRRIDWTKPAFVIDAYDAYNELTDRGLSFGRFNMRQFPMQVCRWLYGNMHRYRTFHVDGRLEKATYWRNYSPTGSGANEAETSGLYSANRTPQYVYSRLLLSRLQDVRVFTDYEPRNPDSTQVQGILSADATVEMVNIPDDGKQLVHRDRHILLQGFSRPMQFYQPDYSQQVPQESADYRRTLYWNPNARTDEDGRFTAVFYNNGKETRIKMSAAGISSDGLLMHSR